MRAGAEAGDGHVIVSTDTTPFPSPAEAVAALTEQLSSVDVETVEISNCVGRVLAEPLRADRPSPACDVSAMDGFAVRVSDLAD
jgi:molybdopterin molybdotransferase